MTPKTRSLAAWAAILAMALQALWPLLAQAKPKSVVLVPVCTVQGVTHYLELSLKGAPGEPQSDPRAASQHDHCSFCTGGGDRIAPPCSSILGPISSPSFALPASELVLLEYQSPVVARPRAPPAASR